MSKPQGNTKDLNAASSEALQALVNSLSFSSGDAGTMLSSDAATRLTSKIREFMGEEAMTSLADGDRRRGELTNEEGLPIIDITEPVNMAPDNEASIPLLAEEEKLVSLSSYSPEARERRRQEMDRILDTLEEEERRAEKRQPEIDAEKREVILRRRKEAAAKEKEKMKAAREMQKKMAKALVRNVSSEKEPSRRMEVKTAEKGELPSPSTVKKTVSFAELSENEDRDSISQVPSQNLDWGDVAIGRLRPTSSGPSLLSLAKLPVKQNVIERIPGGQRASVAEQDSDDESEPPSPTEKAGKHDLDAEEQEACEPPESDSDSSLVEDGYDIDYIQHQREIALQYYEKRSKFSHEALRAIAQAENAEEANVDVTVDTPTSDQVKPAISRFKANRIASSYNLHTPSDPSSSTSLGGSVLPVSSARALQKTIRTGKLDARGRLVGPDHDSESDGEIGNAQDVLELLRKGQVTNMGPDGNLNHLANSAPTPSHGGLQGKQYAPLNKLKTSKFKASRVHRPTLSPPMLRSPDLASASAVTTPISEVPRSSPKLPTAYFIADHKSSKQSTLASASSSPRLPVATTSPMVIESPSFPVPVTSTSQSGAFNPLSMIVESPSFPNPNKSASPTPPSDAAIPIPTGNIARLQRPPTVLASTVREARPGPPVDTEEGASLRRKKVSRFKAERTG